MKFIAISALAAVGAAQYAAPAPAPAPAPVAPVYAAPAPAPVAPVYAAPAPAPAAYAAPAPAPAPAAYAPAPAAYAPAPAAYGPAPAAYGPAPIAPVPFALAAGKAMLAKFCLAPAPGSPLAQALAGIQAVLQALTLGASDAQIAGCAMYVSANPGNAQNNFFSCLVAPSCNAGTLSPCVAGTTCTPFSNTGLLGGPGFCANDAPAN